MSKRAKEFSEMFGDLPDGAFFAMAEEHGIDLMEFADQNEIIVNDDLDTLETLKKLKIKAIRKNACSFQLTTPNGFKVMYYKPRRKRDFIYNPRSGQKLFIANINAIPTILNEIDKEQSC